MNKKQFYYLVCIIKTLMYSAVIAISAMIFPTEDMPFLLTIGLIIICIITELLIKSYIKKAFDIQKPELEEEEDLKELDK